jgi:hypothetical protein
VFGQALTGAQGQQHDAHDGIVQQNRPGDFLLVKIGKRSDIQLFHVSRMEPAAVRPL